MKFRSILKPRVSLWAKGILLGILGLGMGSTDAFGQDNRPIPKSYLNKGTVHLPIQIDDRVRMQLQEVQLFVKDGPQAPWTLKERVPGTQTFFTFKATHEGEYWFNVVTVDRSGRAIPPDITKEPPGLIVIIDSTPPQAEAQILATTPEGQQIRCDIRDANADPAKTRFLYQTRDQVWRTLEAMNGQPDTFCIPGQAAITGMIRVVATDMAGNTSTREFNIATLPTPSTIAATSAHKGIPNVLPDVSSEKLLVPTPPPLPDNINVMTKAPPPPVAVEIVTQKTTAPGFSPSALVKEAAQQPFSVPSGPDIRPMTADSNLLPVSANMPEVPAKRHVVNNCHVFLDYQIEQAGISGVGRVEVWYTRDMGQTWQKLNEDPNRKGQAEIDLPGEGVYGVSVVVSNGRGFGATPPQTGDTPDYWIEIDTTKPRAELLSVRSNPNGDDGALHITWSAKDKNLHSEPIDLFYAINRQGPWFPIAKGLKNEGLYRWTPGAEIGSHAFIKLSVRDQAGNTASCETMQPVALDDLSRPRGRVVGVTTVPRTSNILGTVQNPLTPNGN